MVFHSSNTRLRTRTSFKEGLIAFAVFEPNSNGTFNGIPVRPGLALAVGLEAEAGLVVDPGWKSIAFLLPAEELRAHLAARKRTSLLPPRHETSFFEVEPALATSLFAWGEALAETAAAQPEMVNDGVGLLSALKVDIFEKVLAVIDKAVVFEPGRSDLTRQRRSRIVKVVEEYALAQQGANIHVTDLCRITGVSERTLEYAFKEVMGMTPVAFLAKLRLNRVRQALIAARLDSTTVAAEALRWGFWHFGEFARAYGQWFGELPSETLARDESCAKRL